MSHNQIDIGEEKEQPENNQNRDDEGEKGNNLKHGLTTREQIGLKRE